MKCECVCGGVKCKRVGVEGVEGGDACECGGVQGEV